MPPAGGTDADRIHYDTKLGGLEAEVKAIHKRLDDLVSSLKPKAHVYAVIGTLVLAMFTIGTFALTPITSRLEQTEKMVEQISHHNDDGHPEAVLRLIDSMDRRYVEIMNRLSNGQMRDEDRMDQLVTRTAVLETIAEERTERFKRTLEQRDKMVELRSSDRWTGSQQSVHAAGIEMRLRLLEEGKSKGGGRRKGEH